MAFSPDVPRDTHHCGNCGGTALEQETVTLQGWMGTNWDVGFEVRFECQGCGRRGKVVEKDDGTRSKQGCVAPPQHPDALGA